MEQNENNFDPTGGSTIFVVRRMNAIKHIMCIRDTVDVYGKIVAEFGYRYGLYDQAVKDIILVYERLLGGVRDYMRQIRESAVKGLGAYEVLLLENYQERLDYTQRQEKLFMQSAGPSEEK